MSSTSALRNLCRPAFAGASRSFSSTSRAPYAKMQVIGRLAAQPEKVNTSTGREIIKYAIASNYGPKDNQQTSWWRVVNFQEPGPSRDYILSLEKGTLVHLEADAQMSTYDDEGKTRSSLNLIQRHVEVLARPKKQSSEIGEAEELQHAAGAA